MRFNANCLHAIGLAGLLIGTSPALAARQGDEIAAGWFKDLLSAGASVAEFGGLHQDGDATIIDNVEVRYPFHFKFSDKAEFSGEIAFTSPRLTFEGLSETDSTFSATRLTAADDSTVTFDVTAPQETVAKLGAPAQAPTEPNTPQTKSTGAPEAGTDDAAKGIVGANKTVSMHMTEVFNGVEITKTEWPRFKKPEISREHRFSDSLRYAADLFAGTSADAIAIRQFKAEQKTSDRATAEFSYDNLDARDIANGRIGEERIAGYQVKQQMPTVNGESKPVTTAVNTLVLRGLDIRPVFRAIDPTLFDAASNDTVVDEVSMKGFSLEVPDEDISVAVEGLSATGLGIARKDSDILALADRLATGADVDAEKIARAALQAISGYRLGKVEINSLQVDKKGTRVGQIDHLELANLNDEGLGSLLVEGAGAMNPTGAAQFGLSRLMLGDLHFPSRDALFALKDARQTGDIQAIMKAIPTIGRIELDDALFSGATRMGSFTLANYRLLLDKYIGPIPTDITSTLSGLDVPVSYIGSPTSRAILSALGFDALKVDQNLRIHWNAETQDLDLEQADVSLENGGTATVKLTLGGVPAFVFEDPRRAQEAIATLSIKGGSIVVEDASAITRMVEMQATQANVSKDKIREATIAQIRYVLGPLADTAFASDLTNAADRFMQDPKRLEIRLQPVNPVPVAQILGMAATAPQAIPDLLKASASAD